MELHARCPVDNATCRSSLEAIRSSTYLPMPSLHLHQKPIGCHAKTKSRAGAPLTGVLGLSDATRPNTAQLSSSAEIDANQLVPSSPSHPTCFMMMPTSSATAAVLACFGRRLNCMLILRAERFISSLITPRCNDVSATRWLMTQPTSPTVQATYLASSSAESREWSL